MEEKKMAFFDDLGKKISKTGQDAVKKTKDMAEIMKLNGMVSDEERNINNCITEIGNLYLEKYADKNEEGFAEIIARIEEAKGKIAGYKGQIVTIKGVTTCPVCGAEVATDVAFCGGCGQAIEKAVEVKEEVLEEIQAEGKVCSSCGAALLGEAAFCGECGQKVE